MARRSMPIEQQESLVASLKQGRPDAFEQLYSALHGSIFNLAARITGDTDEAADITQEVFVKAYTRIPTHEGELRLEPWLYRVAVNTSYDHLRHRASHAAEPLEQVDDIADCHDEYERSETGAAVTSALARISPRYRTALVLKDLHGFGNAEIAETLGVSQGNANVLLFRARSAFRKAFRETAPVAGRLSTLGLAAYLPDLPIPQALQQAPDFTALATSAAGLAPAALPLANALPPAVELSTAPIAGVLSKIAAVVGSKVAVATLGVAVVAGGGVAVHEARTADPAPPIAAAQPAPEKAAVTDASTANPAATADAERHRQRQAHQTEGKGSAAAGHANGDGGRGDHGDGSGGAGQGNGGGNGGPSGGSGGGTGQQGQASGEGSTAGAGGGSTSAPGGNGSAAGTGGSVTQGADQPAGGGAPAAQDGTQPGAATQPAGAATPQGGRQQ